MFAAIPQRERIEFAVEQLLFGGHQRDSMRACQRFIPSAFSGLL